MKSLICLYKKFKSYSFKQDEYKTWIKTTETYNKFKTSKKIDNFIHKPKISIILPVYNVKKKYLKQCIDSVCNQLYYNWELCIADDCSTVPYIKPLLLNYQKKDPRIKVIFRAQNGHISDASNSALSLATGEIITFIDNDDLLPNFALFEVVKKINELDNDFEFIYSDEDKITENNVRLSPFFKQNYAPDTLNSIMYIGHLSIFKTDMVKKLGGLRSEYNGCQDYDLIKRYFRVIDKSKIHHIPKILYHWRLVATSLSVSPDSKPYAIQNGIKAIQDNLDQLGFAATVSHGKCKGQYIVNYKMLGNPHVTIIIPTKDLIDYLNRCIVSIFEKSTYTNFDILIVDNQSSSVSKKQIKEICNKYNNINCIEYDHPFNYSRLNNVAVKFSEGEYLLFLNNDTEILTPEWINQMLGYCQQAHVGAVGAKLYYPDKSIQHAGVIAGLGIQRVAGHAYSCFPGASHGYYGALSVPFNYSAVTAACMMVAKEKFLSVGGFDENLAIAYNDVDFCFKLLEKGFFNVFLPQVELIHYESKTRGSDSVSKEKMERFDKEIQFMKKRWKCLISNDPFYNPNLSLDPGRMFQVSFNKFLENGERLNY